MNRENNIKKKQVFHLLLLRSDLALRNAMASLIIEALSNWEIWLLDKGSCSAMSVKISDSLLRRNRAASRDFSFLFSEFLFDDKNKFKFR